MDLLSAVTKKFHRRKENRSDDNRNESRNESPDLSYSRGSSKSSAAREVKGDEGIREKSGLFPLNQVDTGSGSDKMVE